MRLFHWEIGWTKLIGKPFRDEMKIWEIAALSLHFFFMTRLYVLLLCYHYVFVAAFWVSGCSFALLLLGWWS